MDKTELLERYRHSMAHILAKAMVELYGKDVQYAIGPQIEDGAYYDFLLPKNLTEDDFPAIENKMREIIKRREPWPREDHLAPFRAFQGRRTEAVCESEV